MHTCMGMHTVIYCGHRIVCLIASACFQGRGRRGPLLPERVRRSLNPTLYRNIEYDVWHKTKRGEMNRRNWISFNRLDLIKYFLIKLRVHNGM